MVDPEVGFTSDVIRDTKRFVGRTDLIRDCVKSLNTPTGLIAIYGKRGVGKSSLLRQLQQIALGDYTLPKQAGLEHEIPLRPRRFLTVYYSCDSMIKGGEALLSRLCNDNNPEDGLVRLVPDDGKELTEFTRGNEGSFGADLRVFKWDLKGTTGSKYAKVVPNDVVQTFRNFIDAVVSLQVQNKMKRDGLLILLDEFDVIQDKTGIGSLIKSLTSPTLKFALCGIGHDLNDLVTDHASVERLLEEGAIHVLPMDKPETESIFFTAEKLFRDEVRFERSIVERIAEYSQGYPYFAQLFGKECVNHANRLQTDTVNQAILDLVVDDIRSGKAFPTLEKNYQRAIGNSPERELILHLLAGQKEGAAEIQEQNGKILLKSVRKDAEDLDIQYLDQLVPRLVDPTYGPVLRRDSERQGVYEFVNPVLRLYVRLRRV